MFSPDEQRAYHNIVARSWVDEAFRKELIANPKKVLTDHQIHVPDDVDVSVNTNSERGKIEFALPKKPDVPDETIKKLLLDHPDPCV